MWKWWHPDRTLGVVTLGLLGLALLPTRWLVPWTADVASIFALPVTPLGHAANSMVAWVRDDAASDFPDPSEVEQIIDERNAFRGRWHAARLRIEQLEAELQQLQQARASGTLGEWTPRRAQVVRVSPGRADGMLWLNLGTRQGVRSGTVAVTDGDRLVGHVPEPGALSSVLVPLGYDGDRASTDLHVRVLPGAAKAPAATEGVSLRLAPSGQGELSGLLERGLSIRVGDVVRLGADPGWAPTGWGMIVGTVSRIEQTPETPLRERIVVTRAIDPTRLAAVTLKLETSEQPPATTGGAP